MKRLQNLADLQAAAAVTEAAASVQVPHGRLRVLVGMATCGIAAGASPVLDVFRSEVQARGLGNVQVLSTGCIGACRLEPMVEIRAADGSRVTYVKLDAAKAARIVQEHLVEGRVVDEYTIGKEDHRPQSDHIQQARSLEATSFFGRQFRIALRNCGLIDPESIGEYIARDGYAALGKALLKMTPVQVIDVIKQSGLRGRGGGGFPTGRKWEFAAAQSGPLKYVICNADEGDPGAFMDRSVLEGDPHSVLEAMAIAGYAIGAAQGFIYVRAEYPLAVQRLGLAIRQAREAGLLGDNILGSGYGFDVQLRLGAGAFVCGEEIALITSIEGQRGEPKPKPPFPAIKGLWQKPTVINNVETLANIPVILLKGAAWFTAIGTPKSPGTKVFAVGGKIGITGLVEIPMGTTLREIIYDICGGIPGGKRFKAAQTGGPSGGCIPAQHLDTPIDYESLTALGSMMGSGGLIVMDEDNCMVDIAKFFLDFTVDESCGKCPPCRIGTVRMHEILQRITAGEGREGDLEQLEELAGNIKLASLCGLGQTAPNPVLSTLRYFRDEYEAHIRDKRCPAASCRALVRYEIDPERCCSCGLCVQSCPVAAIHGSKGKPYLITRDYCIACGACAAKCPFTAIHKH